MIVRDASESDLPYIVASIQEFVNSSSYRRYGVNVAHVTQSLRNLIAAREGIVTVLERDGEFAGCYVGLAHQHLFSGEWMLGELFLYTTRAARGHGSKLKAHAESWAKSQGCKESHLAHPIGSDDLRLEPVYRRWGYEPVERNYVKDLV